MSKIASACGKIFSIIGGMTQRKQIQWVSESENEADTIHRLAVKAQLLAAEHGEELTYEAARSRAKENLAWVHKMAGGAR